VGHEPPVAYFAPGPDLSSTCFHRGFHRRKVKGQEEARAEAQNQKEALSEAHREERSKRLAGLTKHRSLGGGEDEGPERMQGRKRFEEVVSVRLAGPDAVRPREPNMEGKR